MLICFGFAVAKASPAQKISPVKIEPQAINSLEISIACLLGARSHHRPVAYKKVTDHVPGDHSPSTAARCSQAEDVFRLWKEGQVQRFRS